MWDGKRKESSLETSVVEWAKKHGVHYCIKLQGMGNKSYPDRLFLMPGGKVLMIEFKRPGETPTKLQEYCHDELRNLGYDVEVHSTRQGAIESLQRGLGAASPGGQL